MTVKLNGGENTTTVQLLVVDNKIMNTELILPIVLYGIGWGAYHFWGYSKTIQKVMTNPDKYSQFTVLLCRRLSLFPKILVSVLTALLIPILVIVMINLVSLLWGLLRK